MPTWFCLNIYVFLTRFLIYVLKGIFLHIYVLSLVFFIGQTVAVWDETKLILRTWVIYLMTFKTLNFLIIFLLICGEKIHEEYTFDLIVLIFDLIDLNNAFWTIYNLLIKSPSMDYWPNSPCNVTKICWLFPSTCMLHPQAQCLL